MEVFFSGCARSTGPVTAQLIILPTFFRFFVFSAALRLFFPITCAERRSRDPLFLPP